MHTVCKIEGGFVRSSICAITSLVMDGQMDAPCSCCHSTPREIGLARLLIKLLDDKHRPAGLPRVPAIICASFFRSNWAELNRMMEHFLAHPNQHASPYNGIFDDVLADLHQDYGVAMSQTAAPGSIPFGKPLCCVVLTPSPDYQSSLPITLLSHPRRPVLHWSQPHVSPLLLASSIPFLTSSPSCPQPGCEFHSRWRHTRLHPCFPTSFAPVLKSESQAPASRQHVYDHES